MPYGLHFDADGEPELSADASAVAAQAATDAAAKTAADKATADASAKAVADKAATDAAAKATSDKAAADTAATKGEYQAFKLPDGAKLEGETLKKFTDFAKSLKLDQAGAQAFVDRELALQKEQHAASEASVKKAADDWAAAAKADAEIGGADHDANQGIALKALETFGSPELQSMLKTLPFGKHPEVVRFLWKIGKAISADGKVIQGGTPNNAKTPSQQFYTSQPK